jgi:formylglycine-generating enzyme required for sulfatase activity
MVPCCVTEASCKRARDMTLKVPVGLPGSEQARLIKAGGGRDATECFRDVPESPEMVVVPSGSFMMGTAPTSEPDWPESQSPQHLVTLSSPFAVGRYAVTRGQFAAFVKASGFSADGGQKRTRGVFEYDANTSWRNPGFSQDDTHPVVCVSWRDANAYAAWLTQLTGRPYRLPTEAEWEYSARAGTTTRFWWGDSLSRAQANWGAMRMEDEGKRDMSKGTEPADTCTANPWGLYNVIGNTWEWCADPYHYDYVGAPSDGSAWLKDGESTRVLRGGSWLDDSIGYLRSSARGHANPDNRHVHYGFRVVRSLDG